MKLIAALALLAIAPAQQDVYEKSWSSKEWTLVAMSGDAPERVAVLIDRKSVKKGTAAKFREVNLLSTVEGTEPRWGIVAAIRVDCEAKAFMELGRVIFTQKERKPMDAVNTTMVPIKPDSGLYKFLPGICKGDWKGTDAFDGPATGLQGRVFGS